MGSKNNRTCIICGKQYSYCPSCGNDVEKPTWYFLFNDHNCHDIYEVCTQYRDNEITVEQAYERIMELDISDIDDFAETTRNQIKEILSNGKKNNSTNGKEKTDNTKTSYKR